MAALSQIKEAISMGKALSSVGRSGVLGTLGYEEGIAADEGVSGVQTEEVGQ